MVDYNAPLYQHPQEIWDEKKCKKAANYTAKDGLGTRYSFKGYYSHTIEVRYNGGCIRNGEWYQGERKPLPKLAEGYAWYYRRTWGWQIIKVKECCNV